MSLDEIRESTREAEEWGRNAKEGIKEGIILRVGVSLIALIFIWILSK